MSRSLIGMLAAVIMAVFFASIPSSADVPHLINYQGRLTDGSGDPVTDGPYAIRLRIYGVSSGGSVLWDNGVRNVNVTAGLFSYILGDSVALPDSLFRDKNDLWLGIAVGGDAEISPRARLTATGWSIHSNTADRALIDVRVSRKTFFSTPVFVNSFAVVLGVDTIMVPDSGYVIAEATANLGCLKAAAAGTAGANIEFRDSTLTHLSDQEFLWVLPAALPAAIYSIPAHIHRAFKVGPGRHIITIVGSDFASAGHTFTADPIVMTLIYDPASPTDEEFGGVSQGGSQTDNMILRLSNEELEAYRAKATGRK